LLGYFNMEEEWKPVKGYEGRYEVSSLGRARNAKTRKFLNHSLRTGYHRIYMDGKLHTLHRLIAEAFLGKPEDKPHVNHLNGIRHDNRIENLEWCTRSENMQHSYRMGFNKTGKENSQSKALHVFKDGNLVAILYGNKEWKEFGLEQACVNKCIRGLRNHHKGYTFKKEEK